MKIHDVAIVGAGPAGVAAAIQLRRYGITPLLLEPDEVGGLLRNANLVENYPGFPNGISGASLVKLLKTHLDKSDVNITAERLVELKFEDSIFHLQTEHSHFCSRIVILATGTIPRKLSVPGSGSERIIYEIHSLLNLKGKKIAIVGAGDAAFDYALNLSENNIIEIYNRSNRCSCLTLLWDRAESNSNIHYCESFELRQIASNQNGLDLHWKFKNDDQVTHADILVGAIGRDPNLDFLDNKLKLQLKELQNSGMMHLIGDLSNGLHRQAGIATGEGIETAMKTAQKLQEIGK